MADYLAPLEHMNFVLNGRVDLQGMAALPQYLLDAAAIGAGSESTVELSRVPCRR